MLTSGLLARAADRRIAKSAQPMLDRRIPSPLVDSPALMNPGALFEPIEVKDFAILLSPGRQLQWENLVGFLPV